jgi:alpha-glucosidase
VCVAAQDGDAASTLELYRAGLALRRRSAALRQGSFAWRDAPAGALVFVREHDADAIMCVVNVSADSLSMPEGDVLLASDPRTRERLPANAAVWVRL